MKESLAIFTEVLLPIFMIIIAGFLLQKKFSFNLETLTKIQLYLLIPSLIFLNIANSQLQNNLILEITSFTVILFFILMFISFIVAKFFKLNRKKEKAFMNAVILRNQGNFGIPLITLVFLTTGNEFPLAVHMIALFTTNLLLNTVGLYNASSGTYTSKEAIINVLKLPMIYVVLLGFVFKGLQIGIPSPIESSLSILANGVVPLALLTLGAQLSNAKLSLINKTLPIAVILRLIISPLIAYAMTLIMGMSGEMARVLILGAAAPTAVNSVLLAIEFKGDAEYASETVFLTTLLSTITVTIVIILTATL